LNRGVKWLFTNEAINVNQYLNDLKNRM
ncbi:TPA: glycerophosphodiester phosphodiesterase, partial [Legionella pneumophila]|nr:glycerophosphodiester phosphodiesterase [Legionella pneumophila]